MAQVVGRVVLESILPLSGELLGNMLTSTGMDDIFFGINAAMTGQFSWSDYGTHKLNSLGSSLQNAMLMSAASFGKAVGQQGFKKAVQSLVQSPSGLRLPPAACR